MICAYCKMVRAENTAPCPNCGAPSPLQAMPQSVNEDIYSPRRGGLLSSQSQASTANAASATWGQQPQTAQQWSQAPQQWVDVSSQQQAQSLQQWGQPLQPENSLPVPYQGGMGLQTVPQPNGMQVMSAPTAQDIIIAPPHEEEVVYIPPMYTNPRPIIPRYRIISGFLSVIIVSLMLCGGAGYYAKASGKLDMVSRVLTGNNPALPSLRPTMPALPDPPDKVDIGNAAAYSVISSATTTAHLVKGTTIAAQTDKIFKPNELFFLTYSVHPTQTGTVTIKWYMSNMEMPYSTVQGQPLPANQPQTGEVQMVYAAQAEGKVELYWNNQLAQTLYFVVRN